MSEPFPFEYPLERVSDAARFERAVNLFFSLNAADPNRLNYAGADYPKEWLMARALVARVIELEAEPSEVLLLAAHCQHLKRWESPRSDYPEGRKAYLEWRAALKHFHADESAKVLESCGYEEGVVEAVRKINLKEDLKANADCQCVEDALCLVFLEFQLDDLLEQHSESKIISILKKTAAKMSERGLAHIEKLPLSADSQAILSKVFG